ncbi:MAG: sigma-54 dependent transcriptional regulator [Rhodospirillales bacterium]
MRNPPLAREVLIVDDEADIRLLLSGILEDEGYTTRGAADADQTLDALAQRMPHLIILDIWLEGSRLDGLELLQVLIEQHPDVPIVMISGHGSIEMAVNAIRNGAYDFIEKPFKTDRLLLCIERAMEAARLKSENQELQQRAGMQDELIGRSASIAGVRQAIQRVAPTNSRVLITGPPGSGKEVAARMVHRLSRRASGPFVVMNCGAVATERLELELFGTEGDSSVGASRKIGSLERAHGGTLLLDEVGDLPKEMQGRIVRVLQDQSFERLGGKRRIEIDVRVIAASNRDLSRLIREGRFREDLYYRLNVVPIVVPPLSERREDVPLLADHLMQRAASTAGLPSRQLANDALATLQSCDWPGNIRQLRNAIEWALIMAPGESGEPVTAGHLPPEVAGQAPEALRSDGSTDLMELSLREAREVFERQYLEAQLLRFGGNISRTATFVGMERSALHRKLRSLGVQADR